MLRKTLIALALIGITTPSFAQSACGDRSIILNSLSDKYKEEPSAMGLSHSGSVVEVLMSPTGNTWTLLMTMPSGQSCLVASGEHWENRTDSNLGQAF